MLVETPRYRRRKPYLLCGRIYRRQMEPDLLERFRSLDPRILKLILLLGGLITVVVLVSVLVITYLS